MLNLNQSRKDQVWKETDLANTDLAKIGSDQTDCADTDLTNAGLFKTSSNNSLYNCSLNILNNNVGVEDQTVTRAQSMNVLDNPTAEKDNFEVRFT